MLLLCNGLLNVMQFKNYQSFLYVLAGPTLFVTITFIFIFQSYIRPECSRKTAIDVAGANFDWRQL